MYNVCMRVGRSGYEAIDYLPSGVLHGSFGRFSIAPACRSWLKLLNERWLTKQTVLGSSAALFQNYLVFRANYVVCWQTISRDNVGVGPVTEPTSVRIQQEFLNLTNSCSHLSEILLVRTGNCHVCKFKMVIYSLQIFNSESGGYSSSTVVANLAKYMYCVGTPA